MLKMKKMNFEDNAAVDVHEENFEINNGGEETNFSSSKGLYLMCTIYWKKKKQCKKKN